MSELAATLTTCHYCAEIRPAAPLTYTRSDGVPGQSYPICDECSPEQVRRLERGGFTMDAVSGRSEPEAES